MLKLLRGVVAVMFMSWSAAVAGAQQATVLTRDAAAKVLPATVFFRGQTAGVQARNSAGLKFADGALMLTAVVDTSGYSSAIQQSYQAYLLTEVPLLVGDKVLPAGAYGYGFVAGGKVTVMDVGGHEVLSAMTTNDAALARPTPLQILADPAPGRYRLYLGRSYVTIAAAP
jgi:hypothetical protein